MKKVVEKSKKSDGLQIIGLITIIVGILIIFFSLPAVFTNAARERVTTHEITFEVISVVLFGSIFLIAGSSTFFFKKLSFYLYICSLVFTLFYFLLSLSSVKVDSAPVTSPEGNMMEKLIVAVLGLMYIYGIPLAVSSAGIILSGRDRRKKIVRKYN